VATPSREMGSFSEDPKLCDRLRLWELPDRIVFEPTDAHSSQFLSIVREDGQFEWISWFTKLVNPLMPCI
jgi:hypothetical protein